MSDRASLRLRGLALTGAGVFVLSPDALLIRLLGADTATTLFWRGLAMAVGLGVYLLARERGSPRAAGRSITQTMGRPLGWLLAAAFTLSNLLFVITIERTTIAHALGCLASASMFAAVLSVIFLGERAPLRTWVASAVVAAGLLAIALGGDGDLYGRLAGIGLAMAFGALFVCMRAAGEDDVLPGLATGGLLVALVTGTAAAPLSIAASGLGPLAGMAVVLPVSFVLIGQGPRYLPAPEVSLLMLLETVFGTLWAWLFLAESPSATTLAAVALILATLAVFYARNAQLARRPAHLKPTPP